MNNFRNMAILTLAFSTLGLGACETVEGAGEDIQHAGQAIEDAGE